MFTYFAKATNEERNGVKALTIFRQLLLFSFCFGGLVACQPKALDLQSSIGGSISGSATMFSSSSSSDPGVLSAPCLSGVVTLHALNSDGSINAAAIATSSIADDGSFTIPNVRQDGVTLESSTVTYVLKASGCGNTYYRPLTDYSGQTVTGGSTLVGLSTLVSDGSKRLLNQISRDEVKNTLASLDSTSAATLTDFVDNVTADPTLSNSFQSLVNFSATKLKDLPPDWNVTAPLSVPEFASSSYSVNVSSWNTDYVPAYQWTLDGNVVSSTQSWSFSTTKNSQGTHSLVLKVGQDNAGSIDLTKPVKTTTLSVVVSDDFPAIAPAITLVSAAKTNTNAGSVNINTGAALANCTTLSTLALTESPFVPPLAAAFTITCTNAVTQNQTFTLSSGDGTKTLALWAKDAAGNISASPTTATVLLDQTNPSLTLSNLSSLKGGVATNVTYSTSDAGAGLQSVLLDYASDGVTFVNVTDLVGQSSPYAWSVPTDNTTNAKIRITATDQAGNSSQVVSSAFTIDSTAPAVSLTSMNSGSYLGGSIQNITWTTSDAGVGFGTTPIKLEYTADNGTTWNTIVAATANSSPYAWTLPLVNSAQVKVRITSTDAVGNVNTAVSSSAFTIDSTAPTLSLTSLNSGNYMGGSIQNITWTTSDALSGLAANPIKLEYTANNGTTWNTIVAATTNTSTYAWTLPTIDSAQVKVRITSTDAVGNASSVTSSSSFTIDSTAPVLSSVTINGGAIYAGSTIVNVQIGVSDSLSSSSLYINMSAANTGTNDCQSEYADANWLVWTSSTQNFSFNITPIDGTKKICVWAKDAVGNITVMSPTAGTAGVNYNTIIRQAGNPPQMASLTVSNTGNGTSTYALHDPVTIAWSATDTEGLDNNPIALAYSTNGTTWYDIVTAADASISTNVTWLGSLSGNPTSASGSYTSFLAPSAGFFEIKAVAKDQSGSISVATTSQPQNTGNWSVFAGTLDRGDSGSGTTAALFSDGAGLKFFAINPQTNDIYAIDYLHGIRKLDAKTGLVSTFIAHGTANLPNSGTLSSSSRVNSNTYSQMIIDPNGIMYWLQGASTFAGTTIYKINLNNNHVDFYIGGGTDNTTSATPSTIFVGASMALDSSNNLYFISDCNTAAPDNTTAKKLMMVSQNSDGTPGTFTDIAGNCTVGTPTMGQSALTQPLLAGAQYTTVTSIAAINPNFIYLSAYGGTNYKIINGTLYSVSIGSVSRAGTLSYNPINNRIYRSISDKSVVYFTPNSAGNNGEVLTTLAAASGAAGSCVNDGTDAASTCVVVDSNLSFDSSGQAYFADGVSTNGGNGYRIRYVDSGNKIRTIFGSMAFYGDGLNKNLIRGSIGGIYYKKSTESNLTAFPSGLYLTSPNMVFGYVGSDNVYHTLWGNQQDNPYAAPNGTTISSSVSMGAAYSGGDGYLLAFDSNGLPWLRESYHLVQIDANNQVVNKATASGAAWDKAADGADPATAYLGPYGGYGNLTLKGVDGAFLSGAYYNASPLVNPIVAFRYLDFTNSVNNIIFGGSYTYTMSTAMSPDITVAGNVKAAPLYYKCVITANCHIQYVAGQDRLYFSNTGDKILRYISNPTNTAASTLTSMPTQFVLVPYNFILKEDLSQIFYITGSGLYCIDISSGKAWCNNTNLYPYSATMGAFVAGPNQMTWKDSTTLLISTYGGQIFQYVLPP